jgi:phosphoribosylformimino-5-aminoimidazole carboxamide ribotide isomerase
MQGTDLSWFESLRKATSHELTAAGGITTMDDVKALNDLDIHCAIGMAIYTGRMSLEDLRSLNSKLLSSSTAG